MSSSSLLKTDAIWCLTLLRLDLFGAAHRWGGKKHPPPLLLAKICHTYPIMMKLGTVIPYLKKTQKTFESRDTPLDTAQKIKFSIKDFFSKYDQIRRTADLVTFTEEILNGKIHFLCSVSSVYTGICSPEINKFCYIEKCRYRLNFDA